MIGEQLISDLGLLRHAVAATNEAPRKHWGYRNYFAAGDGPDREGLDRMVALGFAKQGRGIPGGLVYYHVTTTGCEAIGMTAGQTRRACGDNKADSKKERAT